MVGVILLLFPGVMLGILLAYISEVPFSSSERLVKRISETLPYLSAVSKTRSARSSSIAGIQEGDASEVITFLGETMRQAIMVNYPQHGYSIVNNLVRYSIQTMSVRSNIGSALPIDTRLTCDVQLQGGIVSNPHEEGRV